MTLSGSFLPAQSTNIAIGNTILQPAVKRMGMNLGTINGYDSGQMMKNLIVENPGFEGQIWNSTIRCAYGTATSCTDENQWANWPAGFWNGATYQIFYGSAAGRTGTVASSSAPGYGSGVILNFADSGVAPGVGDYLIVRKSTPGGSSGGWWPYTSGAGYIGDNFTDLPPGTLGKQTAIVTAPAASDFANIANFFDSTAGQTFVQLNGTYTLQFKAKGTGGSKQANVQLTRYGGATYINQAVALTTSWNTYTLTFSASESGSAVGTVGLSFSTIGADSFELDDVSLTQNGGDPTNTTAFRDSVITALRTLQPGILRYWGGNGHLGETLDNFLAQPFGRQRAGFSAWTNQSNQIDYGLHDFLQLCQLVGAEPWFVVPSTFSTTDASNLMEYLAGASTTTYGAKRAALGQTTPWSQVFSKIHLEFGNEEWNSTFSGGSILYPIPDGNRGQTIFAALQGNPSYVSGVFDFVLGGQAASPGLNSQIQNSCNNNTSFAVAPYTMGQVDTYSDNESLYGPTFAEPEAFMSSVSGTTAEGFSPGMVYEDYQAIQTSSHPVPLSFYEINLSTLAGGISQQTLNTYTPSLGAGLMVADTMLQGLRQFGVVNQELFALPQYEFTRPDGKTVLLWGSVFDMGVTNRRRPQYLALQLANQALTNGASMLQTVHSGADPTWNQALVNTVQFTGAHYLQSFAFSNGVNRSAIVFNLSRTSALPVTFSGANAPSGTVQMQQLTSANPTDTNETANVVNIATSTLASFNPTAGISLPPYSMTVLTWSTQSSGQAPVISSVTASSVGSTSATITWTTDQASTSQVQYGTTASYGSSSSLNSTLVTSHSVTLTGLTPGTTYNYDVTSANSAGLSSNSTNLTFTTPQSAPVISAVTVTSITGSSATVTWTTDQASTSEVLYGTSLSYGSVAQNASLVTSHSVSLTGLLTGTTYNFSVVSANSAGTVATSNNFSFSTAGGPVISAVAAINISSASATITWTTDQASSSQVQYGTSLPYSSASVLNSTLVTTHSVTLTTLKGGVTYNYDVLSSNSLGLSATSGNFTFTTPSTAPVITAVTAANISATTAVITWTTDQASSSQVKYGTTTAFGSSSSLSSTLVTSHSVTLTGLTAGTTYDYEVISANSAGTTSTSTNFTFSTVGGPVISAVTATGVTGTAATITWTTDQASSSQVKYGTTTSYGSTSTVNSSLVTSHSVALSGLTAGTTYDFAVVSANSAGLSTTSANATFSTPAASSNNAPNVGYVAFWGITSSGVTISWSTDVAATTQVAYGTTMALGQLSTLQTALATSHGVTLSGLNGGTTYYFVAQSTGSNGLTGYSTIYSFTTLGAAGTPVISGITVVPGSNNTAQISWTTSVPTYSYVQYGPTTAYNRWSSQTALTTNPNPAMGWVPSGLIHYQLVSTDASGNQTISPDYTFTEP